MATKKLQIPPQNAPLSFFMSWGATILFWVLVGGGGGLLFISGIWIADLVTEVDAYYREWKVLVIAAMILSLLYSASLFTCLYATAKHVEITNDGIVCTTFFRRRCLVRWSKMEVIFPEWKGFLPAICRLFGLWLIRNRDCFCFKAFPYCIIFCGLEDYWLVIMHLREKLIEYRADVRANLNQDCEGAGSYGPYLFCLFALPGSIGLAWIGFAFAQVQITRYVGNGNIRPSLVISMTFIILAVIIILLLFFRCFPISVSMKDTVISVRRVLKKEITFDIQGLQKVKTFWCGVSFTALKWEGGVLFVTHWLSNYERLVSKLHDCLRNDEEKPGAISSPND